jgi:hypothetical protein
VAEGVRLENWVGKSVTLNIRRVLGLPTLRGLRGNLGPSR